MSSAAFPDIKVNYTSISPQLSENINEYLGVFTKLHKLFLELVEKVANVHTIASTELFTVAETFQRRISEVTKGKANSPSESIVKFLHKYLEQIELQAKTLQNLKASFSDCVVKPLQESVDKKKKVWETCFQYADSFVQQINKKDDDLQKRHKDYSDAASKVKPGNTKDKQLQIFHDSHNTYLLRLSSVNSINNLLYTHVLPHTVNSIELNHAELNDQVRHHVKYLFSTQKDMMKKLLKSVDKLDHATDKIDIVLDLKKFIKVSSKSVTDKNPPVFKFALPRVEPHKVAVLENIANTFVINKRTQPNLQRRLAALQQQTETLVDSIASMRAEGSEEIQQTDDPALNELIEYLCICDKEANLNVLLKQMELYTAPVIDFLGPMPDNLLSEQRHTNKSPDKKSAPLPDGQQPHQFIEPRVMKPISCVYCGKLIALIGKGYSCKVCKISVHKKCATNVQFCQPNMLNEPKNLTPSSKLPSAGQQVESSPTIESSYVYDLIDLESDDDYYDDDEFDDGLSDESDYDDTSYHNANQFENNIPPNYNAGVLQPEKPAVLPKPNLVLNSPLVKVLPDLLASVEKTAGPPIPTRTGIGLHSSQSFSVGTTAKSKPLVQQKSADDYRRHSYIQEEPTNTPILEKYSAQKHVQKPTPKTSKPSVTTKPAVKSEKPKISAKPSVSKKPVLEHKGKPPLLKQKPVASKNGFQSESPSAKTTKLFCVSLYDYRGNEETDLSFVSGCKIELIEKTDNDWWFGASNGYEGYFPAQYVLEINENDCIMRALFQFNKESETELDVDEGAILILVKNEDDWMMVRSKDGEGLVPASYVEQVVDQLVC